MSIVWKVSVYVNSSFTLQSIHGNSSLSSFSEINKTEDNRVTARMFWFFVYKPNFTEANKWPEDIWGVGGSEGPITKDGGLSYLISPVGKVNSRKYID